MTSAARGKTVVASSSTSALGSTHNDYLLRALLSAFARSNFDECASLFRAGEEPLINFVRLLPLDVIIARFPSSRQLLEAIYFRLSVSPLVNSGSNQNDDTTSTGSSCLSKEDIRLLHCSVACKEIINYIADAQQKNDDERAKSHCYALLTSIARLDPGSIAMLRRYYCLLENSLATLGDNVLTCSPTADGRPCPSWDVLTGKLEALKKSAKFCLAKMKSSASSNGTTNSRMGSMPSLLANAKATFLTTSASFSAPAPLLVGDLTLRDVEDRLMLAVSAFPHLEYLVTTELTSIQLLVSHVKTRMDADKRLLLLINELRPRSRVWSQAASTDGSKGRTGHERVKVADLLHRYKRAIGQALEWILPGSLESISSSQLSGSLLSLSLTADGSDAISSSLGEYLSPGASVSNGNQLSAAGDSGRGDTKTFTTSSTSSSVENNSDAVEVKPIAAPLSPLHRSVSEQLPGRQPKEHAIVVLTDNNRVDSNCSSNRRSSCIDSAIMHSSEIIKTKSAVQRLSSAEDISLGDIRPSCLVERFTSLYTDQRMALLDAMDELRELDNLEALKIRLILSVVVLSFRQSVVKVTAVKEQAMALAGLKADDLSSSDFASSFAAVLCRTCGTYPLDDLKQTVLSLVLEAVINFPRMHALPALHTFVNDCVRLAWCLSVQQPAFIIGHSATVFDSRVHERFYASTSHSDTIKTYIWPALILGCETGPVICKAVVET